MAKYTLSYTGNQINTVIEQVFDSDTPPAPNALNMVNSGQIFDAIAAAVNAFQSQIDALQSQIDALEQGSGGGIPAGYVETAVILSINGSPESGQMLFNSDNS